MGAASQQVLDVRLPRQAKPISLLAISGMLRAADVLIIILVGYLCYLVVSLWKPQIPPASVYFGPIVVAAIVAIPVFQRFGIYDEKSLLTDFLKIRQVFLAWMVTVGALLLIAFALKITAGYSRIWSFSWISLTFFALVAFRFVFQGQIRRRAEQGRFANRVVIVGTGAQGRRLAANIRKFGWPYTQFVGFVDDRTSRVPETVDDFKVLGGTNELIGLIQQDLVDDVILALPWSAERRLMQLIEKLSTTAVHIRLSPDLVGFNFPDHGTSTIAHVPVLGVFERPISGWSQIVKRAEDIVLSSLALAFLAPLMGVIAVAIKLDSSGPVFFQQKRIGFNNNLIEVLKFRTMHATATDSDASVQVKKDDERVTRVGALLRRTSLDELPQLLDVLRGDMSIVGPRPHAGTQDRMFSKVANRYAARHRVKPGMTGWAQVNGWRGETDTAEKIRRRIECDLYYVDNWSPWLDLLIIAKTILVVLRGDNAY